MSAFRVQRNSPLNKCTSRIVHYMQEAGLYDQHYRWSRADAARRPNDDDGEDDHQHIAAQISGLAMRDGKFATVRPLTVRAMRDWLWMWLGSAGVAVLVFCVEVWWSAYRRRADERRRAERAKLLPFVL